MRATILANACGAAIGGLSFPLLLDISASYDPLFAIGGGAMLLGALATLTRRVPS
jgi:hypothetical protein